MGILPRRVAKGDSVHGRPDPGEWRVHHRRGRDDRHRAGRLHTGHGAVSGQRPRTFGDSVHKHIQVSTCKYGL